MHKIHILLFISLLGHSSNALTSEAIVKVVLPDFESYEEFYETPIGRQFFNENDAWCACVVTEATRVWAVVTTQSPTKKPFEEKDDIGAFSSGKQVILENIRHFQEQNKRRASRWLWLLGYSAWLSDLTTNTIPEDCEDRNVLLQKINQQCDLLCGEIWFCVEKQSESFNKDEHKHLAKLIKIAKGKAFGKEVNPHKTQGLTTPHKEPVPHKKQGKS